jgi:hypothetical protein
MGDVTAGQIKLLTFCITFYILFSFFGYVFANNISPTNQTGVEGITLESVGVPTGTLYSSIPLTLQNNGTWSDQFTLGVGADQDKFKTHWVNATPVNDSFVSIVHQGYWFWVFPIDINDYWNNNGSYSSICLNVSEIVDRFDVSKNYTKIQWRVDPNKASPNRDYYMFITDANNLRNNMTAAIYVDHKINVVLAKGIITPSAANFMDYIGWLLGIMTFSTTWGLNGIPIFNIILWFMTILTGLAIAFVIKSMVSGWT